MENEAIRREVESLRASNADLEALNQQIENNFIGQLVSNSCSTDSLQQILSYLNQGDLRKSLEE